MIFEKLTLQGIDQKQLKLIIAALASFSLYLTIALAVCIAVAAVIVYKTNKDGMQQFAKKAVNVVFGYSVALIAVFLFLNISRSILKKEILTPYYWFLAFAAVGAILLAVGYVLNKKCPDVKKIYNICALCAMAIFAFLLIILLKGDTDYTPSNKALFYILSALLCVVIFGGAFFFNKDSENNAKYVTYAGVCIATSYALSFVKFLQMPQGGSITLASMLPLMLFAYKFGTKKGVLAGFVYGLLQLIQNPVIYHPLQMFMDYMVAFSALGLTGMFRKFNFLKDNDVAKFALGAFVAGTLRYLCHVVTGIFVFYTWAEEGYSAVAWGFVYNAFVFVDLAIVLVVGCLVLLNKSFKNRFLYND